MRSKTTKKDKKGLALIGSVFLLLFLSIFLGIVVLRATMQLREVDSRTDSHHAFYAAEAGIDRAVFELRKNPHWQPDPVSDKNVPIKVVHNGLQETIGTYSLELTNGDKFQSWETVRVRSRGYDQFNNVPRVIDARIVVVNPAQFLILTDGNLRVGSGASIDADTLGRDIVFEVNDTLPSPDRDININGNIFYLRDVSGENDPAIHFNNGSSIQQSPSITFAGVDLPRYRALAQALNQNGETVYQNGDLTVNLDQLGSGSTPFPKIIFVEGDIHISGEYAESLLVVAKGDIYVTDNLTHPASSNGGNHPQIGLLSDADIFIAESAPDDLTVQGFLIADGDEDNSQGVFQALGPKFSKTALHFEGAIAARGREGRSSVDLNVFRQRDYLFDADLSSNPTIPFSPFIANIIQWKEVSPFDPFPKIP